jgi:hypothetical protein
VSRLARLAGRILTTPPPRHKLHAVRFRRLTASLRELVALCDDATEKLEGEWILDRSYAAALGQRALELGRSIVFDSHVLSGEDSGRLFASLDTVRVRVEERLAGERATDSEPRDATARADDREEPEYRLLREVLERVSLGAAPGDVGSSPPPAEGLGRVVAEAHEEALRSFEALRPGTWGRRTGRPLRGAGFPGSVRVVDAGGGAAPPGTGGWRPDLEWAAVRSAPLRALLEPLAGSSPRESLRPERRPDALAVLTGESATFDVRWPRGSLFLDACLGDHAEANVVYVALRGGLPAGTPVLEDVVASEGFRLVSLAPGLTAWIAGHGPEETRRALGRLGEALPALVSEPGGPGRRLEGREASATAVGAFDGRRRA